MAFLLLFDSSVRDVTILQHAGTVEPGEGGVGKTPFIALSQGLGGSGSNSSSVGPSGHKADMVGLHLDQQHSCIIQNISTFFNLPLTNPPFSFIPAKASGGIVV